MKKIEDKFGHLVKEIRKGTFPCAPGLNLMRPKTDEKLIDSREQQNCISGVGILLHLAKYTQPDIANAVCEYSKMMDGATDIHYKSLLRLIKYVIETKDHALEMKPEMNGDNLLDIEGYCNSDYASNKHNRKSITGMVIYLCGSLICWK